MATAPYSPAPGAQQPSKYDRVGPHYQQYGEQAGYIYYPPTDSYYQDPNYAKNYAQKNGYGPAAPPGLGQTVLPIAAAGGALALGNAAGKDFPGFVNGIEGLFGLGSKANPGTAAPALAQSTASAPGLMNIGGVSQAPITADGMASAYSPAASTALDSQLAAPAAEAPGMFSLGGIGTAGNLLLPAAGAFGAYDTLTHPDRGPLLGGLEGAASGAAIGTGFLPGPGTAVGAGIGGLIGLGNALLNHKTTKDYEKDTWNGIAGATDPATQNYAKNYLNYLGSDQAKTDALAPNTFDAKKAAGTLTPEDVWGASGQFDTFGSDWLNKYTEDQRRKIAQGEIDQNVLGSSHGDTTILDQAKARQIAANILAGKAA